MHFPTVLSLSLIALIAAYLAAAHFQNHRIPADEACYTCHTN